MTEGTKNGTVTTEELDDLVKQAENELFSLEGEHLPVVFIEETLIDTAINHMQIAIQCRYNIIANRDARREDEADRLAKLERVALLALARIKHNYPQVIAMAKEAARIQSENARRGREEYYARQRRVDGLRLS